jgi:hypothetical protein
MPAHIEAVPHEDGTAYQIIGQSLDEVWAEIARLMSDDHGGAEFEKPHRAYSIEDGLKRWRARGIVKPLTPDRRSLRRRARVAEPPMIQQPGIFLDMPSAGISRTQRPSRRSRSRSPRC